MDTKTLIESLLAKIEKLEHTVEQQAAEIASLKSEIGIYKNKKNSRNSHTPPFKDENRPKRNQSLRGDQAKNPEVNPVHEGTTLECSAVVDATIDHIPN